MGVLTVSTRVARNHSSGSASFQRLLPIRTGICPLSGPDSHVLKAGATSIAMSAPELPAPTRRIETRAQL